MRENDFFCSFCFVGNLVVGADRRQYEGPQC